MLELPYTWLLVWSIVCISSLLHNLYALCALCRLGGLLRGKGVSLVLESEREACALTCWADCDSDVTE